MAIKKHVISLLALLIFVILAAGSGNSSSSNNDPSLPDTSMAKVMCDSFMEKQLKAPSSADFAGPFDGVEAKHVSYQQGIHTYELMSFVDAQNSFGAKIRTKFYCKISNQAGNESWTLVDLKTL